MLYQLNISQMREPYTTPLWDKWKTLLPVIHEQASRNPNFLWRYQGENDDLGYIAPYSDKPLIMGNFSAWRSETALYKFTFGAGTHGALMKRRDHWFEPWPDGVLSTALWWGLLDDGGTIEYAKRQMALLQSHGPRNGHEVFTW